MNPPTLCPLCTSARARASRSFAKRGAERLALARCPDCRCEFLWPQPSDSWLGEEYKDYYARRASLLKRPKIPYFTSLLGSLDLPQAAMNVLELGSGEGDAVAAINQVWPEASVTAVESHPDAPELYRDLRCELRNVSVERWLSGSEAGDGARRKRYDLILLFDLIEHLRDPKAALRTLVQRDLAPGGMILATFPNSESLTRRLLGRLWFHYTVQHLFYFSRASVEALESSLGLRNRLLEPLTKNFPVDYFLAVAANFGPPLIRNFFALLRRVLPAKLGRTFIRLRVGDWLWIARTPSGS